MSSSPLFQEPVHPVPVPKRTPTAKPVQQVRTEVAELVEESESAARLLRSPKEGIPELIESPQALAEAARALSQNDAPTAVDTERAQGYRYGGGAYLVQLRKEGVGSFLIDSFKLPDLSILAPAMTGPWILHAADQDLLCMTQLGLTAPAIFDTEIAAKLLGFEHFSLGAVTEHVLGISLEKSHQNEDWSLRPLPIDWLRYAALDVELLPELLEDMTLRLEDAGRLGWAEEEFAHELAHPLVPREVTWRDTKGLGKVRTPLGLAIARELWTTRDQIGRDLDTAPGRILPTAGIVAAALENPQSKARLTSIEQFRRTRARKYTDQWWRAISRARALPESELPSMRVPQDPDHVPAAATWKRTDPVAWERLQTLRDLAKRAASPLGVQPEVVLEPKVQRQVAWWELEGDLESALIEAGARSWQVRELMPAVSKATVQQLRRKSSRSF
ncbi:HRDC domain-containing protein [Actinomyces minihominis]|uniref:HRDC domain-containing protein n=1 Tax=Actinomyces minihominis TaxID=2002838 RepID=UPI000C06E8C1|nr:HRDC domain-containing protein [Actinomyces minihominis]